MIKNKAIIQTENGCRILTNPEPSEYTSYLYLLNPDLTNVRGTSPESWYIDGNTVKTLETARLPPPVYKNEDRVVRSIARLKERSLLIARIQDQHIILVENKIRSLVSRGRITEIGLGVCILALLGVLCRII